MAFDSAAEVFDRPNFAISVGEQSADVECHSDVFKKAIEKLEAAGLGDVLYTPSRLPESYNSRVDSYWSLTPRLRPWAIIQPRNTAEVARAVVALVSIEDLQFAIRSGGHTCYPGSNNIKDGITIDLGLMDTTVYNSETKLATLQPGGRWTKVYGDLQKLGVMVAGGREGLVGVGGLLTGGGLAYYTCNVGFACDQVLNYEIVLADGTIAEANESVNPDLFRALKGGSNNFGIVTRFDMKTFPACDVYDGIISFPPSSTEAIVNAYIDFTTRLHEAKDAHILAMWISLPQMAVDMLNGVSPDPSKPPDLTMVTMIDMILTQLDGVEGSKSLQKDIWFTLTYRLDKRILNKTTEVYEQLVNEISARSPGCVVEMVLQPLPTTFGQHSLASGGNMLGLERFTDDAVLLIAVVEGSTPGFYEMAFPILKAAVEEIESYAKSVDGDIEFRYLNYCNGTQDPLGSYGVENIKKMKAAAAKYDPLGVFQTRVPGGFKISKVKISSE
ncbi:hypothetical protein BX600DRAFT_513317 [Xylariales sp. PMI_506]|nr:hypothetical protein BX600DRAFT_513317 [Xylariales sp. PMI_506]